MKLRIDYQCPQCGAPATIEETDRLFSCEYCRVKSYLYHNEYFQYVLPSNAPDTKDVFFMPYWRFKGMIFSCINNRIEHKFADVSLQAFESTQFPVSVGLRSQSLKMKFVTPDMKGYFIKPNRSLQDAMRAFTHRFAPSSPETLQHQTHVGDAISIVFSPFYTESSLVDAVLNKPIRSVLLDGFDMLNFPGGKAGWSLTFIPTLCPNCGWDLEGERESLALICRNCSSIWTPLSNTLKRLHFGTLIESTDPCVYFPFWRIKTDISGVPLSSYADLVRIANLPKAIQKGWETTDFYFWVPGFKVRPKTFLRLLSQITTAQPMNDPVKRLPAGKIFPITLSAKEAADSLKINLASFMKNDTLLDSLSRITIQPTQFFLVFIPFHEGYHDFIQTQYQMAINKNQLSLATNL